MVTQTTKVKIKLKIRFVWNYKPYFYSNYIANFKVIVSDSLTSSETITICAFTLIFTKLCRSDISVIILQRLTNELRRSETFFIFHLQKRMVFRS